MCTTIPSAGRTASPFFRRPSVGSMIVAHRICARCVRSRVESSKTSPVSRTKGEIALAGHLLDAILDADAGREHRALLHRVQQEMGLDHGRVVAVALPHLAQQARHLLALGARDLVERRGRRGRELGRRLGGT